jgi:hypothetical protein
VRVPRELRVMDETQNAGMRAGVKSKRRKLKGVGG